MGGIPNARRPRLRRIALTHVLTAAAVQNFKSRLLEDEAKVATLIKAFSSFQLQAPSVREWQLRVTWLQVPTWEGGKETTTTTRNIARH
eukprot:1594219-Prorocentrum_lima.AAC.1